MKTIRNWSIILIPAVILAVHIGQRMTSDIAAVFVGGIIGLLATIAGLLAAAVWHEIRRPAGRQHQTSRRPELPDYIEGRWREIDPPQLPPAETTAIVPVSSSTTVQPYR